MNPFAVLHKYYDPASELYRLLVIHSLLVAKKALDLAAAYEVRHPEEAVDREFIAEAALLHDLGIFRCRKPEIFCAGGEPYVSHGLIGREILEAEGLPRHALVCERHTGAGITEEEVLRKRLPLPARDYLPVAIEEKVICLADKFYSKSPDRLFREKPLEEIRASLARWGPEVTGRFEELRRLFLPGA
ncbi:MAG: HD domain-containing protein [Planctomycetes bacterium]|nr:HD domain-containing protein [Planctomycetota bacterium]